MQDEESKGEESNSESEPLTFSSAAKLAKSDDGSEKKSSKYKG